MFNGTLQSMNQTLLNDTDLCTLDTCPLEIANFTYVPSLPWNLIYLAIFGLCFLGQAILGIRHKTWGFLVGMLCGLALEIVGYVGRIQLHYNPFLFNPFLINLVCLTIAPALLSFSIYTTLGRIISIYGTGASRLQPATYTLVFVICDFISLVLQAAGGAMTATADKGDKAAHDLGVNIMLAGLGFQVFSLLVFIALCVDLWYCITRTRSDKVDFSDRETVKLRGSTMWKAFLLGLAIATVTIFIRCIFRCAELSQGFDGSLANNEVLFMTCEGLMLIIACVCLTVLHPGTCFKGQWSKGDWSFKTKKGADQEKLVMQSYDSAEYRGVPSDDEVERGPAAGRYEPYRQG